VIPLTSCGIRCTTFPRHCAASQCTALPYPCVLPPDMASSCNHAAQYHIPRLLLFTLVIFDAVPCSVLRVIVRGRLNQFSDLPDVRPGLESRCRQFFILSVACRTASVVCGQSSRLLTQMFRVRFPELPHFLLAVGLERGQLSPREDK
jgi:hypothetical protein